MGLFYTGEEERSVPGFRKSGFPRYKEVLERSWKDFVVVGFVTLLFYLPLGAGLVYAVGTRSALLALLAGALGGAILGPGYACMVDLILRRLRDDLDDRWVCWKRAMRQNARAAVLPGIVQGLLIALAVFAGALIYWGAATVSAADMILLGLSALLGLMVLSVWWPQVVLFEQKPLPQLKNAVFFCLIHFGRALISALLQLLWWAVMFLFLPWTAFVVPVLGLWYILFLSLHVIYPLLDKEFRIEEQIGERFPGTMGR